MEQPFTDSAHVLKSLTDQIIEQWMTEVRKQIPPARELAHPILINTLPSFLKALTESLSPDFPRNLATETNTNAEEHGGERARLTSYDPQNLVYEYQILKGVIFAAVEKANHQLSPADMHVINSSIDTAVRDAVTAFVLVQTSLRERFMATLTHDLRNPLSAIAMAASLILKKPDLSNVPILAAKIVDSTKRIDRMVQDLLDATLVGTGGRLKFEISEFDLLELVQETAQEMAVVVGDRFKINGEGVRGYWGRDALKRAIENLLTNAEKYGDPHEKINVILTSKDQRATLSVHNFGPPIPIDDQEAIFQAFLRAQSARTGTKKGWGLGLALVRGVAEGHGGSVLVDSALGRGTTFTIDIPLDSRAFSDAPTL